MHYGERHVPTGPLINTHKGSEQDYISKGDIAKQPGMTEKRRPSGGEETLGGLWFCELIYGSFGGGTESVMPILTKAHT